MRKLFVSIGVGCAGAATTQKSTIHVFGSIFTLYISAPHSHLRMNKNWFFDHFLRDNNSSHIISTGIIFDDSELAEMLNTARIYLLYVCMEGQNCLEWQKKSLWEWASNNNVSSRSITDVVWPLKKNCEMKMSFCCSSLSLRDVATIKLCLNYIYVATSHIPLVVLRHLQTVIINHFRHQPHSRSVYVPAFGSIKYSKRRIHKSNTMKEFALRQTEWATNKHTNTISAEQTVKMKVENDYDNFKVGQKKKEAKFWRNKGKENRN